MCSEKLIAKAAIAMCDAVFGEATILVDSRAVSAFMVPVFKDVVKKPLDAVGC